MRCSDPALGMVNGRLWSTLFSGLDMMLSESQHLGEDRRLLITPECGSFEEVEGQINSLQDELDEIRERARRTFQVT